MSKSRSLMRGPSITEIREERQAVHNNLMFLFDAYRNRSIERGVEMAWKDPEQFAVLFGYAEGKRKRRLADAQE